jgi:hypothetical protein
LNYGDGAAEIKYSSKKELVNFSHYYNINTEKTYNITLTVLGYTPEGKKIIEKISRNITLPNPLLIVARSPVDLTVTDPDGLVVSKQVNEIPGSVYSECDINQDGHLDDLIYISDKKIGDYFIDVVPEPGVELTDIYTLQVWANNITLTLAENVEIKDIPTQPYIVRFTKDKVTAFNYRFEGLKQGTRLYINTNDKTFQFIAPDKEFAVKKADWMQIINLSKSYDLLKYDSKTKSWRVNAFKLALDPSLTSQVSAIQFKEKPKEIILIRHYDQDIWLQAIAIDGKFDFCLALARDMVTKKIYKLFDPPGIE